MGIVTIIKLLSNLIKLIGIAYFIYSAYKGAFSNGDSNTVFIGVAALTVVIVITHIIDEMRRE